MLQTFESISYFVVAQSPNNRLVKQEFDILSVVKDFDVTSTTLCAPAMLWLAWIDAFQDAQSPKIVQGQLELPQRLATRDIAGSFSGSVLKRTIEIDLMLAIITSNSPLE